MKKIACFTGHRPEILKLGEKEEIFLKIKLANEIEYLLEKGVEYFITGMAKGVDIWCGEIINSLKEFYPYIKLECAIPYKGQENGYSQFWKEKYNNLLNSSDKITYVSSNYRRGAMQKRNEYMVNNSEYVIGVWNGKKSGTQNTLKYAKKNNKTIIIIGIKNGIVVEKVEQLQIEDM